MGLQHRLNFPSALFRGAEYPARWDLSSAGFVWDPAQIMSVGIWTNLEACGGWGVSSEKWSLFWQAVRLPAVSSPKTGRFHFYCLRLCAVFSEGFESQWDRITTQGFPRFCLWENSHSQSWITLDQSAMLQMARGQGRQGRHLDTKYSITESDLPPQGEIWNFKSPIPEFSPDSSKGKVLLK